MFMRRMAGSSSLQPESQENFIPQPITAWLKQVDGIKNTILMETGGNTVQIVLKTVRIYTFDNI